MIEVEIARSGAPVLKKNGRFLGSSVDPVREATQWVAKQPELASEPTVFILGLGSGYHVTQTVGLRGDKPVVVIENDPEVIQAAAQICPALSRAIIVQEDQWADLIGNAAFAAGVTGAYAIAQFGPSVQSETAFYRSVEMLLLGRDKVSFLTLLKTRPELLAIVRSEAIAEMPDLPVSIKTMQALFAPTSTGSLERRLWRILEELVA